MLESNINYADGLDKTEIARSIQLISKGDKQIENKILNFFLDDVTHYIDQLHILELKITGNPNIDIQDGLNESTYKIVENGHKLEGEIQQKLIIKEVKQIFRSILMPWFKQSLIMKRALEKPRGYPGDYKMLELIYQNKPISRGIGYYFDAGFLNNQLTTAVRNRKDMMGDIIRDFCNSTDLKEINILDVASGSCREVKDIVGQLPADKKFNFVFVDQDDEALGFSTELLGRETQNISFKFIKEDVLNFVKSDSYKKLVQEQDLIYSNGLIDYIPDRLLKVIINKLSDSLKSKGVLVLSHKDHDKYIPMREDWLSDWRFIPRNEKSMLDLVEDVGISREGIELRREKTEIIFFMIIRKK